MHRILLSSWITDNSISKNTMLAHDVGIHTDFVGKVHYHSFSRTISLQVYHILTVPISVSPSLEVVHKSQGCQEISVVNITPCLRSLLQGTDCY